MANVHDQKSRIITVHESESRSEEEVSSLCVALRNLVEDIWENGLEPDYVDALIDIFCNTKLEPYNRNLILDCIVPQTKISANSSQKFVLWIFKNSINNGDACSTALKWLNIMIRYNLIDQDTVRKFYTMLLKYLLYPYLVKPLSETLCLLLEPKYVNETNCQLVEKRYNDHCSDPYIRRLLWEFSQVRPHVVPKKFHDFKPLAWDRKTPTDFEKVVKLQASRTMDYKEKCPTGSQRISSDLPAPEYEEGINAGRADSVRISDVHSMFELGRAMGRLVLPKNELSLLQSEVGVMYIVVNGPSLQFLSALNARLSKPNVLNDSATDTLIMSVSGLQDLLTYGLPSMTHFLSDFLFVWDGNYKEAFVYSLLPRLHFNTFSDLKEQILVPLTRVFVTDTAETKVKILDSLLFLLTNMISLDGKGGRPRGAHIPIPKWTEDVEGTASRLVEYINQLWIHGITLEGQECTNLVLHAVLFYQNLNTLIIKCNFPLFWVIHPCLSHPALLSKNHAVLNELCSLILSYKKDIIPQFESSGLLGEFESETETVMALADSVYKYLWESVGGERPANFHTTSDEFSPSTSIGVKHMAVYPLVCKLCKQLKRDPDSMTKKELLTVLSNFMKGVAEFIQHEELEQSI